MKRTLFLLISLYMGLVGANAQSNKYDLNEDGEVNVTDVTLLVTKILDQNNGNEYDLNDDEDVNITDVILMVNYILGNDNGNTNGGGNGGGIGDTSQAYLTCPDDNHPHMIDLGLPSGTKWACCNVDATTPEGYGGYYAWGETEEKEHYCTHSYKYAYEDNEGPGWDAETQRHYSYINIGLDISGTEYDVAHVKWGGKWCMPSFKQKKELADNCTLKNTTYHDVSGIELTSKIYGNSIFMPNAGGRFCGNFAGYFSYWSSTHDPTFPTSADSFGSFTRMHTNGRNNGYQVRPVWKE